MRIVSEGVLVRGESAVGVGELLGDGACYSRPLSSAEGYADGLDRTVNPPINSHVCSLA
jgi:hypothetical protein